MKNKNILLRALLTGMLCITSLTIFTGCIDKQDGDGMVNGRTADGELPENGDAEPVPIKANKAGKPEIKDSSTTEEPEQPEEPETTPKPEKKEETEELWSGLSWRSGRILCRPDTGMDRRKLPGFFGGISVCKDDS